MVQYLNIIVCNILHGLNFRFLDKICTPYVKYFPPLLNAIFFANNFNCCFSIPSFKFSSFSSQLPLAQFVINEFPHFLFGLEHEQSSKGPGKIVT